MGELVIRDIIAILEKISAAMDENKEALCELDAKMGDGDLGLTMSRGWAAAAEAAKAVEDPDIGKILIKSGFKMSSAAPSSMGTLFASGLVEAGKLLKDKMQFGTGEFALLLKGLCDGIIKRGHCAPGDRTVLDALWSAAEAAGQLGEGTSLLEASEIVRGASKKGLESTKEMTPKFGRAAVLAEKTKGMEDQGAVAGFLVVDAICEYIEGHFAL